MEAIEEPPPMSSAEECVKVHASDGMLNNADVPVEPDVCHSSNGIPELNVAELKNENDSDIVAETAQPTDVDQLGTNFEENNALVTAVTEAEVSVNEAEIPSSVNEAVEINSAPKTKEVESTEVQNVDGNAVIEEVIEESVLEESVVEVDGIVDNNGEHITFETEIFIEGNHDLEEQTLQADEPNSSNILNEIGQNIELSDALRSSDVSDTVENNNCDQEVFNKEELLDILEGNDIEESRKVVSENFLADSKKLEEHLALQQLNRLKGKNHKKNRNSPKKVDRKQPKRSSTQVIQKQETVSKDETAKKDKPTNTNASEQVASKEVEDKTDEQIQTIVEDQQPKKEKPAVSKQTHSKHIPPSKKESIVNALVKDWSDEEHADEDQTLIEEGEALLENTKTDSEKAPDEDENQNEHGDQTTENNAESSAGDETPKGENTRPQRRLTRVIKKKVIFDPDNPDTFTKTKVHIKKEKETGNEKEQPTPKKIKVEQLTIQTLKSKTPVSKMQWKKPTPKSSKQTGKRLTEVDRLLMDEGAVNMICELTPDALKGNKNMKSKAEYIKNIQSSNPDTKEMKFRERKSKLKSEGDPKKVGSGKDRLSTSVMSPPVSEDFEVHSADDSIIYRRHSSSSYSSTCMSPRRLSDVEGAANAQNVLTPSQNTPVEVGVENIEAESHNEPEIFMSSKTSTPKPKEIMNKRDCLSIKEKLNSKLSQALNKRKRESTKSETPPKVKKVMQVDEVCTDVTINFNQKVAEICIQSAGSLFSIQIMKVLENILALVDSNKNITVTLITSECGTLCSGLDLKPILNDAKHAQEIAGHARSLMRSLEKHSKLVIVGVEGKSQGFSLALAALSDVLLVSEHATFTAAPRNGILHPGAAILNSRGLPQSLLNDLIVFGREVSATEALQGGLVSRIIWPERFQEQVCAIAKDIASQPFENIMLKKQLLSLKKIGSASTFQSCLDKERDLLVKYWTSAEVKELLSANDVAA